MIDLHCHILPGVDDGSPDMRTSLMMAAMAADDGIQEIVATPHFQVGPDQAKEYSIRLVNKCIELSDAIKKAKIPMLLHLGAEVLCNPETMKLLEAGFFPTLNSTRYSLVEFYFDEKENIMEDYLTRISRAGYIPVIAHPERYDAVQRSKTLAKSWKDKGYMLQVNAGSLTGQLGRKEKKTAQRLVRDFLVDVIATDAHNATTRTTQIQAARNILIDSCGHVLTEKLLKIHPQQILGS